MILFQEETLLWAWNFSYASQITFTIYFRHPQGCLTGKLVLQCSAWRGRPSAVTELCSTKGEGISHTEALFQSCMLGTERRLRKHHLKAHSYLFCASPTGIWRNHQSSVNGQRLPCGMLSLWGECHRGAGQRHWTRIAYTKHSPLSRCMTCNPGCIYWLLHAWAGRALHHGSWRESEKWVLAGLQVVLLFPVVPNKVPFFSFSILI